MSDQFTETSAIDADDASENAIKTARSKKFKTAEQIAKLELRLSQAKARLQAENIRNAKRERVLDTKRKILIGAFMMSTLQSDEIATLYADIREYLKRQEDKNLFAL